jgi:hypothetical protein
MLRVCSATTFKFLKSKYHNTSCQFDLEGTSSKAWRSSLLPVRWAFLDFTGITHRVRLDLYYPRPRNQLF